jgi:hypothetical protein
MGTSYFNKTKFPKLAYASENLIAFEKGEEPLQWNDKRVAKLKTNERKKIHLIKAIYQQYTKALIENRMNP